MAVTEPDLPAFQLLSASSKAGGLHLAPKDPELDFFALSRGRLALDSAIEFERVQGSRVGDLVSASGNLVLVSPRFQDLLRFEKFSGWSTFPISVDDDIPADLDGYRGLVVLGRSGPVDFDAAVRTNSKPATPWGLSTPVHRGLPVPSGTWDGSDLFFAGKMGLVFVTPKVAAAIAGGRLKGVVLERASEYEIYSSEVESLVER